MTASGTLLNRIPAGLEMVSVLPKKGVTFASAIAFCYTEPSGRDHWATSAENSRAVIGYLRGEGFEDSVLIIEDARSFSRLLKQFVEATSRSVPPLTFLLSFAKAGAPIMSPKTLEILESDNHYRSTIADLLFIKDMSGVTALVHIMREKGDTSEVKIPAWVEDVRWLTRKWFGCKSIDGAMTVKMASPRAVMIEL